MTLHMSGIQLFNYANVVVIISKFLITKIVKNLYKKMKILIKY